MSGCGEVQRAERMPWGQLASARRKPGQGNQRMLRVRGMCTGDTLHLGLRARLEIQDAVRHVAAALSVERSVEATVGNVAAFRRIQGEVPSSTFLRKAVAVHRRHCRRGDGPEFRRWVEQHVHVDGPVAGGARCGWRCTQPRCCLLLHTTRGTCATSVRQRWRSATSIAVAQAVDRCASNDGWSGGTDQGPPSRLTCKRKIHSLFQSPRCWRMSRNPRRSSSGLAAHQQPPKAVPRSRFVSKSNWSLRCSRCSTGGRRVRNQILTLRCGAAGQVVGMMQCSVVLRHVVLCGAVVWCGAATWYRGVV